MIKLRPSLLRHDWLCLPGTVLLLIVVFGCKRPEHEHPTASHGGSTTVRPGVQLIASKPLRPRRSTNGTLFRELSPEVTGIQFTNRLKPENNVPYIYSGAGVALGDYDNDGRVDIYLLSVDSPNCLFRQTDELRFEDVTDAAGVDGGEAWSRGALFVDINNDGALDLYVCNTEAANLLYVNQGDGTFKEQATEYGLDFVGASIMASAADYDNDGDLDLYVVTHRSLHHQVRGPILERLLPPRDTAKSKAEMEFVNGFREVNGKQLPIAPQDYFENLNYWEIAGQNDALFRNDGNGTFRNVTEQAGMRDHGLGYSCTWLDFNSDGWLDLHVANDLQSKDRLYRNQQDGTFKDITSQQFPHTTWYSMGSDFGDINNDGRFDLLVVDMASTTHYRAKVQMGEMDRFRYFMVAEQPPQLMRNSLFLNSGTESFLEVATIAGLSNTDWTWAVKLNDFDNDGRLDAYFTNGVARADEMNPDLRKGLDQLISSGDAASVSEYVSTQGADSTPNKAFRNLGDLRFQEVSDSWGVAFDGISYGAAVADMDRDGDLDLVVSNHNQPVSIYENQSAGHCSAVIKLKGTSSNRFGIGAIVRIRSESGQHVRQLFPARGYMASDEPAMHFGLGKDQRIESLQIRWPSGRVQNFTDLPVDHEFTVTEPKAGTATTPGEIGSGRPQFDEVAATIGLNFKHEEFQYDDYGVQPLLPGKHSQLGPGMAWGDADGDGDDDLFIGGASGQSGQLLLHAGNGEFKAADGMAWDAHKMSEDMSPLWLDADGDGDLDLFVASGSSEFELGDKRLLDRLYLNDGRGNFTFQPDALPSRAGSSGAAAAADFDGDGDLDLFVGERLIPGQYPRPAMSRLLRNDQGVFNDVTDQLAPELSSIGLVTSAIWSDTDDDGDLDLMVAIEWGPVHSFVNDEGHLTNRTKAAGLADRRGWWNSLAGGDIDADGDIDFVALNCGLNTKYGSPTASKPTILLYGDMDETGESNLVEVKCHDGGLLPVRGLSCSRSAMPILGERFPTFHSFASSTLEEIYQSQRVAQAQRYEANELSSGLLVNEGGHFRWQPLPRLGQLSPGFGATITDLNGDGFGDIYFVQNLFSREPETGVWSGGLSLMLRGNGTGRFSPVMPDKSGLIVRGDAKGMTVTDLNSDGWPDVVAAQNDERLRAFRNSASGKHSLAVRLIGPPGNPTAIGARLTLQGPLEVTQTSELYAGAGYLSQSSALSFFSLASGDGQLEVRWPDGLSSTHRLNRQDATIVIQHPSVDRTRLTSAD